MERRTDDVTTTWWRKDRDPTKLFVDYNQNARDHTIAAAYSVRGNPEGTVSTPIRWDEVDDVEPSDCTIATMPARFAEIGDLHAKIDEEVFDVCAAARVGRARRAGGTRDPGGPAGLAGGGLSVRRRARLTKSRIGCGQLRTAHHQVGQQDVLAVVDQG